MVNTPLTPERLKFSARRRTQTRTLDGSLETNHNIAKFSTTIDYNQVTWEPSNCCHPVSGELVVSFKGTLEGKASAKFISCGTVEIEVKDQVETHQLSKCK